MTKKIIRVFPTKTSVTPDDELVAIRRLPYITDEADEVHISVTFTWDIEWAEKAAEMWKSVAHVKLGGPAYNEPGGDFIPGMYMKRGYVITSRGCNNRCWFCSVPKREGYKVRELKIAEGYIIQDDNLLACSEKHIDKVFEMLKSQKNKPEFIGGLEAKLLTYDMAKKIKDLKPKSIYFAYDTPDDLEPLINAGKLMKEVEFSKSNNWRCYVLCGYPKDSFDKAEKRMIEAYKAGFFPMAMLYRDKKGVVSKDWKSFQRIWANPIITGSILKEIRNNCKI